MIKKFNEFINEDILNKLTGPSKEEIMYSLNTMSPDKALTKSIKLGLLDGVKIAIERGADLEDEHNTDDAFNYPEIYKYLIEHGAYQHPYTLLRNSILLEYFYGVEKAISEDIDLNDEELIIGAFEHFNKDIIELLLRNNVLVTEYAIEEIEKMFDGNIDNTGYYKNLLQKHITE